MEFSVEVQWDIHVQCGRHIYSEAFANNVECMYTGVSGHIVDNIEFIGGIHTDTAVLYQHMK